MLVITSRRELIDTLDARLATLKRQRQTLHTPGKTRPMTTTERVRLDGAIGELALIRDVLNEAAINISNVEVELAVFNHQ